MFKFGLFIGGACLLSSKTQDDKYAAIIHVGSGS